MQAMSERQKIAKLREMINRSVVTRESDGARIVSPTGDESAWLLDFRNVLLNPDFLETAADIFWETFEDKYPFQVGGQESAAIPFITAIVLKGAERGTSVQGFYIRKSRKPAGLQKSIEGKLTDDPIILVDDLINSGGTFLRQIQVLEEEGKKVVGIFAFVRFCNLDQYTFAQEQHIEIIVPFTLQDFGLSIYPKKPVPDHDAFEVTWVMRSPNPSYFYRVPKSTPIQDGEYVYFGADNGMLWALDQGTGKEIWHYKILGFGSRGKTIFSSPAIHNETLYFGAYDGNFYALDIITGKKKWIYPDADWIGSSPAVAPDLGLVYVGLEYGLWNKRGGIVALDAASGEKRWEYISMPQLTHSSPAYSKKHHMVVVGSNDGVVYAFRARDGKPLWQFQTSRDVKGSFAFDDSRGYVLFGSFDSFLYILNVRDGTLIFRLKTGAEIYATPLVQGNYAYIASMDKKCYCINLDTFDVEWSFETRGRMFASPAYVEGNIYVGSNDGCLYELDAKTGRNTSFFQTTERITNKIAYNEKTKRFFLLTYANELYCLERKPSSGGDDKLPASS